MGRSLSSRWVARYGSGYPIRSRSLPARADSPAHADALRALECLAFGLQRRRDHDLGLLELLERLVAGGGHRRAERTEEVHGAVVVVRRPGEDLGERSPLTRMHSRATREVGMEGGHTPVVT